MPASAWSAHGRDASHLTGHAAGLVLAPTRRAVAHLAHEGLAERAALVGAVMVTAGTRPGP
ncbi:hypothetical protein [Nonomuraea dietziae]|uniref:UDP-N-acetylglucosamine 2-epimerase n=1 Tax=Nonomuraea dietziae TaxID=65515 RepID=A0A7W5VIN7_9ACTN|nr:hypothetical protein [Nonomuraea dietziae]MBB3728552.1 UDP-N-acetylglucosamine 2-epimerase [Nonomuraea dietziae]